VAVTKLTTPIEREITTPTGDVLILMLTREGIVLREKRSRRRYLLPYEIAYYRAVTIGVRV
jgi:hypothetical protein